MATPRETLKNYFSSGAKPTENHFGEWIDSFYHIEEDDVGLDGITVETNAIAVDRPLTIRSGLNVIGPDNTPRFSLSNNGATLDLGTEAFGIINLKDEGGTDVISLSAEEGLLTLGGAEIAGSLIIRNDLGQSSIRMDAQAGSLSLGTQGRSGRISIFDRFNRQTFLLDSDRGTLEIGGNNQFGYLFIKDEGGNNVLSFDGETTEFSIRISDNSDIAALSLINNTGNATCYLESHNNGGRLHLTSDDGRKNIILETRGESFAELTMGGNNGCNGYIFLRRDNGSIRISLDAEEGEIRVNNQRLNVPDFIFDENYSILKINEVHSFIKENKHLPDIPSSEEIRSQGVNLTAFSMKLLQKIEELTLYVIDLQEQINELKT